MPLEISVMSQKNQSFLIDYYKSYCGQEHTTITVIVPQSLEFSDGTHLIPLGFKCRNPSALILVASKLISKTPITSYKFLQIDHSTRMSSELYVEVVIDTNMSHDKTYRINKGSWLFQLFNVDVTPMSITVYDNNTFPPIGVYNYKCYSQKQFSITLKTSNKKLYQYYNRIITSKCSLRPLWIDPRYDTDYIKPNLENTFNIVIPYDIVLQPGINKIPLDIKCLPSSGNHGFLLGYGEYNKNIKLRNHFFDIFDHNSEDSENITVEIIFTPSEDDSSQEIIISAFSVMFYLYNPYHRGSIKVSVEDNEL